jgi:hypothetical protein
MTPVFLEHPFEDFHEMHVFSPYIHVFFVDFVKLRHLACFFIWSGVVLYGSSVGEALPNISYIYIYTLYQFCLLLLP